MLKNNFNKIAFTSMAVIGVMLLSACNSGFQMEEEIMSNNSVLSEKNNTPAESDSHVKQSVQSSSSENDSSDEITMSEPKSSETEQKQLGGMLPEEALEYLKRTPDVVIVQVNTAYWKIDPGFTGALWIPHDEMSERYDEIPEDRPVMLHCGAGVVSVSAYETLIEKRPDIPELSYIAGRPHDIMDEYNEWIKNN